MVLWVVWMISCGRCVEAYEKNVGGLRIIQNHGVNTPWVIYPRRGHGVFTACCAMSLARRAGGFSRLPEPAVAWQLNQGPPKWRCAMLRLPKPRGRGKWALFFDFFPCGSTCALLLFGLPRVFGTLTRERAPLQVTSHRNVVFSFRARAQCGGAKCAPEIRAPAHHVWCPCHSGNMQLGNLLP